MNWLDLANNQNDIENINATSGIFNSLKKTALNNNLENSFPKESLNFDESENNKNNLSLPITFLDFPSQNSEFASDHNLSSSIISLKALNDDNNNDINNNNNNNKYLHFNHENKLPKGVEDFDRKDALLPNNLPGFVLDIYRYLRWKECQDVCQIEENFLSKTKVSSGNRLKLLLWMINVHRSFSLLPETLHLCCKILDLILYRGKIQNRRLQLFGIATLWIASKLEEIHPPPISDFLDVTDNAFDAHEMCECEREILQTLQFHVNPPTSLHFLKRAAKVTRSDVRCYAMAKYILELAILDDRFSHYLPSHLSATSLLTAYIVLNYGKKFSKSNSSSDMWDVNAIYYTGYQENDLICLGEKLANLIESASKSVTKNAVYLKYKSEVLNCVSEMSECKVANEIFGQYLKRRKQSNLLKRFNSLRVNNNNNYK